jgi:hypothetical protein
LVFLAAPVLAMGAGPATAPVEDPFAAALAEHGIATDDAGLVSFLQRMLPTSETRERVAKLIEQLSDPDVAVREAATRSLIDWPNVPADQLNEALHADDPEMRLRAARVRDEATSGRAYALLYDVLKMIEHRRLHAAVPDLLRVIPLCDRDRLAVAARDALRTTATELDAKALREALNRPDADVRAAAALALAEVLGERAESAIRPLLADPSARVRAAAARVFATRGDRAALPVLANLIGCDDSRTRKEAARILTALTARHFDYSPADDPAGQQHELAAWRNWIKANATTAELHLPLRLPSEMLGRTLICEQGTGRVVEVDAHRKITFQINVRYPWGCEGLPDGHRLIALWQDAAVVEYDASGKEVWRTQHLPGGPTNVQRLDDGHTLIPCSDGNKVLEVDNHGKVVWELPIGGRPADARRLDNGHTLISLHHGNAVIEVDRNGKETWRIGGLGGPVEAQRLDNGNTLVCDANAGRAIEFDRNGKRVWSKEGYQNPWDAQRLPDGTTLIADSAGVHQVDVQGKTLWEYAGGNRVNRY